MKNLLSPAQIAWASTHDWFCGINCNGTLIVNDTYTTPGTGVFVAAPLTWLGSFRQLRDWAGY